MARCAIALPTLVAYLMLSQLVALPMLALAEEAAAAAAAAAEGAQISETAPAKEIGDDAAAAAAPVQRFSKFNSFFY
jgi:hypothetical protein